MHEAWRCLVHEVLIDNNARVRRIFLSAILFVISFVIKVYSADFRLVYDVFVKSDTRCLGQGPASGALCMPLPSPPPDFVPRAQPCLEVKLVVFPWNCVHSPGWHLQRLHSWRMSVSLEFSMNLLASPLRRPYTFPCLRMTVIANPEM